MSKENSNKAGKKMESLSLFKAQNEKGASLPKYHVRYNLLIFLFFTKILPFHVFVWIWDGFLLVGVFLNSREYNIGILIEISHLLGLICVVSLD